MGKHDQMVTGHHTHRDDTDEDDDGIPDDGRTLASASEMGTYADDDDGMSEHYATGPGLMTLAEKLIPVTVYNPFDAPLLATEWESMYSTVFAHEQSNFSRANFAPIVDDSCRVVGHVGWADGNDILVPAETVRNDRYFWSVLQRVRLGEWRKQILDVLDRGRGTIPNSPFPPPATSSPSPNDGKRWRGPENCDHRPHPSYRPTLVEEARSGPLKEDKTAQYLHDLDWFVKGGGKAFVGRHFASPSDVSYLDPYPGRPDGEVGSPKKPFSSGYEFQVVVDPVGNLKGVTDIRKNLTTQHEKDLEIIFGLVDIAMTVLLIIDIVTIPVALFRLGVWVAERVEIRAIRLALDEAAKTALKIAEMEAKGIVLRGAMAGPKEVAEAFWAAGRAAPKPLSEAQVKVWTEWTVKRMEQLGIPKKNIGCEVKKFRIGKPKKMIGDPVKLEGDSGKAFNPVGTERGSNLRSFVDVEDGTVREGGISVHSSVFQPWDKFEIWNKAAIEDRIDAIIAHEWLEFNGLSHDLAVERFEQSTLNISKKAKEILAYMKTQLVP